MHVLKNAPHMRFIRTSDTRRLNNRSICVSFVSQQLSVSYTCHPIVLCVICVSYLPSLKGFDRSERETFSETNQLRFIQYRWFQLRFTAIDYLRLVSFAFRRCAFFPSSVSFAFQTRTNRSHFRASGFVRFVCVSLVEGGSPIFAD